MDIATLQHTIDAAQPGEVCTCTLSKDLVLENVLPKTLRDWMIYETPEGTRVLEGLKSGGDRWFLPPPPSDRTLLARKKDRYIIYVLAPTKKDYEAACVNFAPFEWARPILIPTTFYLESVVYHLTLPKLYHEWQHAEYVGTVAHSAVSKLADVPSVLTVLREASQNGTDVAAFMYRGDPLVDTAEKWHPGFRALWIDALKHHGFTEDQILSPDIPAFYANYWAATPDVMCRYIDFFSTFRITLETLPEVREAIWEDASYSGRGREIAKIPPEKCMEIWGVPWYPFHPFICERVPCFYVWSLGIKIMCGIL